MNINFCPLQYADQSSNIVVCPSCHGNQCPKHGSYTRKGFHTLNNVIKLPVHIQRYRCRNPHCKRRTFSVLPPMVLRYCRFFWPCLLSVWKALSDNRSKYHIATRIWKVDRGVIVRLASLQSIIYSWVTKLYREHTNGCCAIRSLALMVKIISFKTGRTELMNRWYCYRYPGRFLMQ
jgi:hypothetical protein